MSVISDGGLEVTSYRINKKTKTRIKGEDQLEAEKRTEGCSQTHPDSSVRCRSVSERDRERERERGCWLRIRQD